MADLIVIEYDDIHTAEEVRLKLQRMQRDYLVDLEDAVVATKDEKGRVKLNQIHNLTRSGEPHRVYRRLQLLRGWSYDKADHSKIFAGSARACRADGV